MLVFYVLLIVISFWKCKFSKKLFFGEESFSKNVTDSVKGIFIWLVFLSHFTNYTTYTSPIDIYGRAISSLLGQLIVACFLFYSGYGVCESIKKKGTEYVKKIPKNRILKTLIHFDIAIILYLIIQLCIGNTYSLPHILLSLIGWESLGNSNWYIFVILILYLITWFSFICIKKSNFKASVLATILTVLFIIFLHFTRWSWWYNTALCYILGIWISFYKDKFIAFITKNNITWTICAISSIIILGTLRVCDFSFIPDLTFIIKLLTAPAFCLVIIVFLTKFKISNKILIFSGQYLFEIYILQRIPMILLKELELAKFNHYLYFVLCLALTVVIALIFRRITNKADSYLFKTNNKHLSNHTTIDN